MVWLSLHVIYLVHERLNLVLLAFFLTEKMCSQLLIELLLVWLKRLCKLLVVLFNLLNELGNNQSKLLPGHFRQVQNNVPSVVNS